MAALGSGLESNPDSPAPARAPESARAEDSSGSPNSKSNAVQVSADPSRPLGALHGWLLKRHVKPTVLSDAWAKRYFVVDDTRGTLSYLKAEYSKKAAVVLPLDDTTSVRPAAPPPPPQSPPPPPPPPAPACAAATGPMLSDPPQRHSRHVRRQAARAGPGPNGGASL